MCKFRVKSGTPKSPWLKVTKHCFHIHLTIVYLHLRSIICVRVFFFVVIFFLFIFFELYICVYAYASPWFARALLSHRFLRLFLVRSCGFLLDIVFAGTEMVVVVFSSYSSSLFCTRSPLAKPKNRVPQKRSSICVLYIYAFLLFFTINFFVLLGLGDVSSSGPRLVQSIRFLGELQLQVKS